MWEGVGKHRAFPVHVAFGGVFECHRSPQQGARGLARLDPLKGRAGKLQAQVPGCLCVRHQGPRVSCHSSGIGALDQPKSPHVPGCCTASPGSHRDRSPAAPWDQACGTGAHPCPALSLVSAAPPPREGTRTSPSPADSVRDSNWEPFTGLESGMIFHCFPVIRRQK